MDHLTPDQLRDCLRRATRDERYARLMHDEHARLDAERRMRMYDMRIRHAAGEPWPWEVEHGKQSIVAG
jgi:hypothetical protein